MNAQYPVRAAATEPSRSPIRTTWKGANENLPRPDLTALSRGAASMIERLAGLAKIELGNRIDDCEHRLQTAGDSGRYYRDNRAELDALKLELGQTHAIEAAARSRRARALTDTERQMLEDARATAHLSGSAIDALLFAVPVDPLDAAAQRLEAARERFTQVINAGPRGDEEDDERVFGKAEAEVETARADYRRLLAERAGQDADAIARRMAI
jgi:hypothetical protein